MKKRSLLVTLLAVIVATVSGCTSVSRQLGKLTANKYAEARSGTVWVVAPPQLEPPALNDKTVYISFRNISDVQSVQLLDDLKDAARAQGWVVSNDPQKAKYRLRASLRFFGEVEPESGGSSVGRGLGVITGAAVGAGTRRLIANRTDNYAAGYVGGLATGGLVTAGISNASRPREWAMIIDFVLEEYSKQPVEFELSRSSDTGSDNTATTGNRRMVTGGGSQSRNSRSAKMVQKSHYFPHGIRLSAWANQMNMEQQEALPLITNKVRSVVAQILPM